MYVLCPVKTAFGQEKRVHPPFLMRPYPKLLFKNNQVGCGSTFLEVIGRCQRPQKVNDLNVFTLCALPGCAEKSVSESANFGPGPLETGRPQSQLFIEGLIRRRAAERAFSGMGAYKRRTPWT